MPRSSQRLDKRITIQRPTEVRDSFGHRNRTWTDVASVWAAIRPMGSNERLAAAQLQSGQSHVIEMRHQPALDSVDGTCRIVWGCRHFNIIGFPRNINEGGRWIQIDATEGGADGA